MAEVLTDTTIPEAPSDELLARVGLSREEYERFCAILKRRPNLVELGICGAMWSEHCCYKSSKRHLKTFPVTGPRVIQGPGENAGVMDIGGGWAVVFKIESHNHPSAVEPFQGAATGVGGIIRDIFAMGARPLALLNSLRFGDLVPVAPVGEDSAGTAGEPSAVRSPQSAADNGPSQGNRSDPDGGPRTADESTVQAAADGGAMAAATPAAQVPWPEQPFVVSLSWMTNLRKPLFARGPAARGAVAALRELHGDAVRVQAYCVLPDQVLLIAWLQEGTSDAVDDLVTAIKQQLEPLVTDQLTPGAQVWELSYRNSRLYDQPGLDEAIKRVEYAPVMRQLVQKAEDYNFVSRVWKYGSAFGGSDLAAPEAPAPYDPGVTPEQAARNRYLLSGVVSGIAHYGNCIGIPTVGGEVAFDPSYSSNCLVNAMCVGVVRRDRMLKGLASGAGNTALIVGAKTGRDGVQGATFASADLKTDAAKDRPAVQVGDPFMEKLLLEATLEILGMPGLVGVQDFGAAGLTCSGVEMAARGGTGMRLDLDAVPQRAADLSAYEMMLSESQERMMVVVEAGREEEFLRVFRKWDLSAVACGEVLPEQSLIVVHHGAEVAHLPNQPLANDGPDYDRPYAEPEYYSGRRRVRDKDIAAALEVIVGAHGRAPEDQTDEERAYSRAPLQVLRLLLAHPSIASKRPVYRQYDHMVRTNTVLAPGEADAAVIRIKETGQGLAMCTDGSGRHCYLDPQQGGARAVLEAARNILAVGATPLGVTNNLNFGNPQKPDRMWQLIKSIEGIGEACRQLATPVTGGNVSLYNESGGRAILPTPVLGMVGLLDDARAAVPGKARQAGLELYLLGTSSGKLDGSSLVFELGRQRLGESDKHDYGEFKKCQRFLLAAAGERAVAACHDISDGGLAVALAEFCAGADVTLPSLPDLYDRDEHNVLAALFSEEGHRWLVAVDPGKRGWLRTAALHYDAPLRPLGTVTADWPADSVNGSAPAGRLVIGDGTRTLLDAAVAELRSAYNGGLAAAWSGD
jgi:phosphoribosylformylglycinamidine synthase